MVNCKVGVILNDLGFSGCRWGWSWVSFAEEDWEKCAELSRVVGG